MLWTDFRCSLILWLLGFSSAYRRRPDPLAPGCGLVVLVINLLSGRRSAV